MRKLKITSLVLVVVMLLGMLPLGMFSASAAVTAPATLPNGKAYYTRNFFTGTSTLTKSTMVWHNTSRTMAWLGAEGVMIKVDTTNATEDVSFQMQIQMDGEISASGESFARFSIGTNDKDLSNYKAYRTYTYTTADGATWDEYVLGGPNGYSSSRIKKADTNVAWTYIPMSAFRYMGKGNGSYDAENPDDLFARDLIGTPLPELLDLCEAQNIGFNITAYVDGAVLQSIDLCYEIENLSKPAGSVDKKLTLDLNSAEGGVTKTATNNSLTVGEMLVNNNSDTARAFIGTNSTIDLSDAVGVQVNVDTSALGNAQLLFKMRLQRYATPANLSYANGVIYNDHGTKFQKLDAEGKKVVDGSANKGVYEVFNSLNNDTGLNGGYVQLATRSGGSVAYITGTDGAGKTYTNQAVYTEGTTYKTSPEDAFLLPAGFVGTVYIPMDSYYLNVYGSFGSKMLTPFNRGLLTEFNAFGFYSTVKGTPTTNSVVYSNFTVVEKDVIEINSKADFTAFATALAAGTTYDGKIIKLNTDITYNAGVDVANATSAPAEVYPAMGSGAKFAGIFDGQGHVISGIYLKKNAAQVGIFGNAATGKRVTVKNLTILNSYVEGTMNVGGLFGVTNGDTATPRFATYQDTDGRVTIDNVYLDITVKATTKGNIGSSGNGGFIGWAMTDTVLTNCAFVGKILSGARGTGGFIGCTRSTANDSYFTTGAGKDSPYKDQRALPADDAKNLSNGCDYYAMKIEFTECVMNGIIQSDNTNDSANNGGFQGGLIGYSQQSEGTVKVTDSYVVTKFLNGSGAERTDSFIGALWGGSYANASTNRAVAAGGLYTNKTSGQHWILTDVYYAGTATNMSSNKRNTVTVNYKFNYDKTTYTATESAALPTGATTAANLPEILMVRDGALKQSVTLTDDLALNIYIPEYNVIAKSDDVKVTLTVNGAAQQLTKANGYWSYSVTDILPQEMNKEITASVTLNGKTITKKTSIAAYLKAILADQTLSSAHKLASDLLRYGDASQIYAGYETDKLASKGATLVAGSTVDANAITATTPVAGTNVKSVALRLDNSLALVGNDGTIVNVNANEMNVNKTVGDATCSVAAYVKWALGSTSGLAQNQKDLIKAIYAYGLSAAAYNG